MRLTLLLAVGLLVSFIDAVVGATVTSVTYGTPARTMTGSSATNVIPQAANVQLTYAGTLAVNKWLALVDETVNSGTPCTGTYASAAAGFTQSGEQQASTRVVQIPQNSPATLLDFSKTFAVCFAENDGSTTDATWADSRCVAVC